MKLNWCLRIRLRGVAKMVVIATRVPKETKQKLLELCTAIYGKDKVGPCLKELVRDAIIAYYRLKPSRELFQRTILEVLKAKR